jgi:hypothetical protein
MEIQEQLDFNTSQGLIKLIKEKKEILEQKNFIKLIIESINFKSNQIFEKNK